MNRPDQHLRRQRHGPNELFRRAAWLTFSILALVGFTSCTRPMKTKLMARYWASQPSNSSEAFPELDPAGLVWANLKEKRELGVCFSGGGTRAAAATAGQLRALRHLKVLDDVRYISAVSGGSWTATPFTFLPTNHCTTQFLGEYVRPEDLANTDCLQAHEGSILHAISEAHVTGRGFANLLAGRGSESYARVISKVFLEPFCLGDSERWFTWSDKTAKDARDRSNQSPALTNQNYYKVAEGRPFLIVGGTIRHYDWWPTRWSNDPRKRVPVEYTPLYSGVRPWIPPGKYNCQPIGGGYVESFAYDSIAPKTMAHTQGLAEVSLYRRGLWQTEPLLNLGDIMGSSGAAPGELRGPVEIFGFPKFNYWSPASLDTNGSSPHKRYAHQDGGLSENLGIMPLLARRVKRIIAFVNAEDEVIVGNGAPHFPDYINGLFGQTPCGRFEATQVFEPQHLSNIATQLVAKVRAGRAPVTVTTVRTISNSRFDVPEYDVEIFWVFLDARLGGQDQKASDTWVRKIPEKSDVRTSIENERRFKNFPRYRTFFEDRPFPLWDVVRLTGEKATALAHYTSWVVVGEGTEIKEFLGK